MTPTTSLTVNPQRVIYEVIDGEAIIIELELGNYYSLGGSGPEILDLLAAEVPLEEICTRLRQRHPSADGVIDEAVRRLVTELAAEGLVEPNGNGASSAKGAADLTDGQEAQGKFVEPVLEKYTDMQDYLLVDPIHGVTDAGWPNAKPGD